MSFEVTPDRTRSDPNVPWKTLPRTYGVWDIGGKSGGKRYRYGNFPVRGKELRREFGHAELIGLYKSRQSVKAHADSMN